MFSFFRKIRKSLLNEGKTTRYFKYALGEILLVVIGILIALQMNNWNEDKKERSFELKMLKQIKYALMEDKAHFELMEEKMAQLKSTTKEIVDIIANEQEVDEKTQYNLIFALNNEISTQYNRGPYDALKASGIDKIQDDQLRNDLINFYDFHYPKFISKLEHFNRNYLKNISANVGLFNNPEIVSRDGKNFLAQKFPDGIFKRPDFQKTLRSIIFRRSSVSRVIRNYLPEIQIVIDQLDSKIGNMQK